MNSTRKARLLALDVDGTILTDELQISTATREAVQNVISRGVQVVLASARGPNALFPILKELKGVDLAVSYTGALTCRLSRNESMPLEVINEKCVSLSSAHFVLNKALELEISIGWFIGERWYVPMLDQALHRESKITGVSPIVTPDLIRFREAPHKLQAIVEEPALLARLKTLAAMLPDDCVGQFSYETYLEIIHQGVDKATALLELGRQLGIAPSEMVAIGDMDNDIAMLQMTGLGIAMGNAPDHVKGQADWVTNTNNREGVALAVERLLSKDLI